MKIYIIHELGHYMNLQLFLKKKKLRYKYIQKLNFR